MARAHQRTVTARTADRRTSEIVVTSTDVDTAIEVVRRLRDSGITRAPLDEAAAAVAGDMNPNTFKNKLYSAVKYGFLASQRDRVTDPSEVVLLPLGEQVLDPQRAREAKARAFLNIPLHRIIYQRYRGQRLPSDKELDEVMLHELGVSPGQVANARQAMIRAARQAGFFDQGRDRLAIPSDVASAVEAAMPIEGSAPAIPARVNGAGPAVSMPSITASPILSVEPVAVSPEAHPILAAWLREMPPKGVAWPKHKRDRWYQMLGGLLDYVYADEDGDATGAVAP